MTFWYYNNKHIYKTGDIVKFTKAPYYVTQHDNLMFLRYIVALYIDGKTVFSSSTHIIAEEKTTQNLDISNYGSVFDTRLFCNQRYIDYVVTIRVSIRKRGDEEKALNEFYEYTHKIASRFNGTVKFVMRLSNSVKDRYIETHLDKSWKKEAVKICDKEDEVFTKVFVS